MFASASTVDELAHRIAAGVGGTACQLGKVFWKTMKYGRFLLRQKLNGF